MPMMRLFLAVAALLAVAGIVAADIPAHCLHDDVVGEWSFHVEPSMQAYFSSCASKEVTATKSVNIVLKSPDVALLEDGTQGFWTMVYDQGFEVRISGKSYFIFSEYTVDESGNVTSFCGASSEGWVRDDGPATAFSALERGWGCVRAEKKGEHRFPTRSHVMPRVSTLSNTEFDAEKIAKRVQQAGASWTANPRAMKGVGMDVLHKMAGGNVAISSKHKASSKRSISQEGLRPAADYIGLPREFSWTMEEEGHNVVPMRDQLSCGSCYSFAATDMIASRLRIHAERHTSGDHSIFDQEVSVLSPQQIVSCSQYSQGCDGGFPYLVARYGQDHGIVSDYCFPYQSGYQGDQNVTVPCEFMCKDPRARHFVVDYEYVGGYYGNCSEEAMMRELVANGPLAVGFEVYDDFMAYESGVYHHIPATEELGVNNFIPTNHAVLIVGYGVDEKGGPYWLVKNSWGRHFGLTGFFKIRRGNDECGIESMAVAAKVSSGQ